MPWIGWSTEKKIVPIEGLFNVHPSLKEVPGEESPIVVGNNKDLVAHILNKDQTINFMKLIDLLEGNGIVSFLEEQREKGKKRIFFDFFDFLNHEFFQKIPATMPGDSLKIIRNNTIIKDQVIAYIRERNKGILSMQVIENNMNSSVTENMEQHDIISFHLFLLGMDLDFDLIEDVSDELSGIGKLFRLYLRVISEKIGQIRIDAWNTKEIFDQKLNLYIELCETINQLARLYSVNFEERWVSPRIGDIMEKEIQEVIAEIKTSPCGHEKIPQLMDILGKPSLNFSTGIPITGSNRWEILESVEDLIRKTRMGFETRKKAGVSLLKRLNLVCTWNETVIRLRGIERIEKINEHLTSEEIQEKIKLLSALFGIYNDWLDVPLSDFSSEGVIQNFMEGGIIKNEDQIETIYHIIHFDKQIKNTTLQGLLWFLFNILLWANKDEEKDKKSINSFYEASVIRIIEQIIRIFSDRWEDIVWVDRLETYLTAKNISNSILNHSLIYLALALYYPDRDMEKAQEFFFHYKNLRTKIISREIEEMENKFYATLWKKTNYLIPEKHGIPYMDIMKMWRDKIYKPFSWDYSRRRISEVEKQMSGLSTSVNVGKKVYPLEHINMHGEEIAKQIFYGLCTITIIGDCEHCGQFHENTECAEAFKQDFWDYVKNCPLVKTRRGFQKEWINLTDRIWLVFTYPSFFKDTFERIFLQQKDFLKEGFWNLIASSANVQEIIDQNEELARQNKELDRRASHDLDGLFPNKIKLREDIGNKQCTIALVKIVDRNMIHSLPWGADDFLGLMKNFKSFFSTLSGVSVYRYDDETFCFVFDPKIRSELSDEEIIPHIKKLIEFFSKKYNVRFWWVHIGLVLDAERDHLERANVALTEASSSSGEYIFRDGDLEKVKEIRHYTAILEEALFGNESERNYSIKPYYQRIYDPECPHMNRVEALARIISSSGEVITPRYFIKIAEARNLIPEITQEMLGGVTEDMKRYPGLEASMNIHLQDWNDARYIDWLQDKVIDQWINSKRMTLEILENVSLNCESDIKAIEKLHELWFNIALDDHGKEGGSDGKLIDVLDVHKIKLDKKLIKWLQSKNKRRCKRAEQVIKKNTWLAHKIGAIVTAEWIEEWEEEIFYKLWELGVDTFQWYLFGKPVPIEEIQWEELQKTA